MIVEAKIYAEESAGWDGLWACLNPEAHSGYRCRIIFAKEGKYRTVIEKVTAGAVSVLGEHEITQAEGFHTVAFEVAGGKLKLTIDAVVVATGFDSTYTAGYVGIEAEYGAINGLTNFKVNGTLLDSLERASENPLSNGGKWAILPFAEKAGEVYSEFFGFTPASAAEHTGGSYWTPEQFEAGAGEAVVEPAGLTKGVVRRPLR